MRRPWASGTGSFVITADFINRTGEIKVWNAVTDKELLTFGAEVGPRRTVEFDPEGKKILTCDNRGKALTVWSAATGKPLLKITNTKAVHDVVLSPDGKRIASGHFDKTIVIWDATTGTRLATLRGHVHAVECLRFTRDGKRLISGSHDKTLIIWDAVTGRALLTLKGHKAAVNALAISPDGKRFASGSEVGDLKIWDASLVAGTLPLEAHSVKIKSATFSKDGKYVIGKDESGKQLLWSMTTGKLTRDVEMPPDSGLDKSKGGAFRIVVQGSQVHLDSLTSNRSALITTQLQRMAPSKQWHNLQAKKAELAGSHFTAAFHLQHLLRWEPWERDLHLRRAYVLSKQKKTAQAFLHYWQAMTLDPNSSFWPAAPNARRLGQMYAKSGQWAEALPLLELAAKQHDAKVWDWYYLLLAQRSLAKIEDYRKTCSQVIDQFGKTTDARERSALFIYTTLGPCGKNVAQRLVKIGTEATKQKRDAPLLALLARAEYRAGEYSSAMKLLLESIKLRGGKTDAQSGMFASMILHQIDKKATAQMVLKQVEIAMLKLLPRLRSWQADKL